MYSDDYGENRELGFATLLAPAALARVRPARHRRLDPPFAPGTRTPEAGGLTTRELLAIVRGLAGGLEIVAADVVEVSPPYDPTGSTAIEPTSSSGCSRLAPARTADELIRR